MNITKKEMNYSKYYDLLSKRFSISKIEPASMDASSRIYLRIFLKNNKSVILQDNGKDNDLYKVQLKSYMFLKKHYIPIPEILEKIPEQNILIFRDLGEVSLEQYMRNNNIVKILPKVVNIIEQFESLPLNEYASPFAPLDEKKYLWGFDFFYDYYIKKYKERDIDNIETVRKNFMIFAKELADKKKVLIHRDFHSRNLFVMGNEVFVIDYQDLRIGNIYYDRSSLLYDLYSDFSDFEEYILPNNANDNIIIREMAFQRLIKILGNFAYLKIEKNKPRYIEQYENNILEKLNDLSPLFHKRFHDIYEVIYDS